jgi:deoxyadenosine/deoxycytidine kinase
LNNKPFIGIAGNIGVGKTTFTKLLSEKMNLIPYYESVDDNPYLSDFYSDMERWSFNLQIYFLQHRFRHHIELMNSEVGVIQDRTIYEDVSIFAYNLYQMKTMSKRDWETYKTLFDNMTQFLKKPDLIIYLKASTDTLINRIKNRNRGYEKDISEDYLHRLNIYYKKWFSQPGDFNVLEINTNNFNIFNDTDKFDEMCDDIKNKLNKLS